MTSEARVWRASASVVLLLGLAGACGGERRVDSENAGGPAQAGTGTAVASSAPAPNTFYGVALPILEARCQSCHLADGIAGFALESYDDVAAHAAVIRAALLERRMPPLPPDDRACRPLSDSRKMPESERDALIAWLDGGMERGAPADAPAAPLPSQLSPNELPLGEPTSSARFGAPYVPVRAALDEYRCLVVDPGWSAPRHLRGVGVRPGNRRIVHHVIVFGQLPAERAAVDALDAADDGPGYACAGGAGFSNAFALAGYVPGAQARAFPGGATVTLPAQTRLVVQMHYNFLNGEGDDDTELLFYEANAPSAVRSASVLLINRGFRIPAGQADYSVTAEAPIRAEAPTTRTALGALQGQPGLAWGVRGHMHTRGKRIGIDLLRADGSEECLLDIPRWDFNWQGGYRFMEPLQLLAGDRLRITCSWDNSPQNQPVVDGQRLPANEIGWGEGTLDEMCLGGVQMTQ